MSAVRLGVVMDPPEKIHYHKDSTLAMLWEADRRGWEMYYLAPERLSAENGRVSAGAMQLQVFRDPAAWGKFGPVEVMSLTDLDVILIRKDPPFDVAYLHLTRLLDLAVQAGVFVVNDPQGLRDAGEKLLSLQFPDCCPPLLVSADIKQLKGFLRHHRDVVCKPLDGMGGESVFRLREPDENTSVVLEVLTAHGTKLMQMQRYIPEISRGDKRILLVNGEPVPFVLARMPALGELRGNLAAGGRGVAQPLSARDRDIASIVGPKLRDRGLLFVGLDVIGDWLTEINVTSPTCIREIEAQTGFQAAALFLDCVENLIK